VQGQALNGELGVGDTNSTYLAVPTAVTGNLSFSDISLGEKFTCGIAGSKAFCWVSLPMRLAHDSRLFLLMHRTRAARCQPASSSQPIVPSHPPLCVCRGAANRGGWGAAAMPALALQLKLQAAIALFL